MNQPLAFLDSGIGGLPYLNWVRENLPRENLVYLADRRNFPYGTRSPEEIFRIVSQNLDDLLECCSPKALVLACNTASVTALAPLRKRYELPIIGVVPAVKPAFGLSHNHVVGVLATERTVNDPYLDDLINRFGEGSRVVREAAGEIVKYVEESFSWGDDLDKVTRLPESIIKASQNLVTQGADTVVLGCTHFLHVQKALANALGPGITIVDSCEGVGLQTQRVLEQRNLLSLEKEAVSGHRRPLPEDRWGLWAQLRG